MILQDVHGEVVLEECLPLKIYGCLCILYRKALVQSYEDTFICAQTVTFPDQLLGRVLQNFSDMRQVAKVSSLHGLALYLKIHMLNIYYTSDKQM